jgi:hypothetical protein
VSDKAPPSQRGNCPACRLDLRGRCRSPAHSGRSGKFAAIDIETGTFKIEADELAASERLKARIPEPQIWLVKVGTRYVHRFGGRS